MHTFCDPAEGEILMRLVLAASRIQYKKGNLQHKKKPLA